MSQQSLWDSSPRSGGGELGAHRCQGPEVGMCWETARACVAVAGEALVLASVTPRGGSPERVLHREVRCSGLLSDSQMDF